MSGIASERVIELLNQFTPEGDFNPREVAQKVRTHLEEYEPETLQVWMHEMVDVWLREALDRTLRSQRGHVRRRIKARAFSDAVKDWKPLDEEEIWSVTYTVGDGVRRKLGDMTADDHFYVARQYEASAKSSKMLAALHRSLARRIGDRTTREALSTADYERLVASILGSFSDDRPDDAPVGEGPVAPDTQEQ